MSAQDAYAGARRFEPFVQLGYVVTDLEEAAADWAARGAGPFFHLSTRFDDVMHRGRPGRFDVETAHGQFGAAQIELMRQTVEGPSVMRDLYPAGRSGLHHAAAFVEDLDAALAAFEADGCEIAMTATSEHGLRIAFVDTIDRYGHMLELYQEYAPMRGFFDRVAAAARDWDGRAPLRRR